MAHHALVQCSVHGFDRSIHDNSMASDRKSPLHNDLDEAIGDSTFHVSGNSLVCTNDHALRQSKGTASACITHQLHGHRVSGPRRRNHI